MANTISSSQMVQGAPSVTQLEAREVGDEIRFLGFGRAKMTSLIENTYIENLTGKRKSGKGLISKRTVENIRYEMYNRSPRPFKFTVATGTEVTSTGITVSESLTAANGIQPGMTLHNANNLTSFRVEAISTGTIKGSSYGATTFSCTAGDPLILGATAVEAGNAAPIIVNGTDDNYGNTLQFSRLGVSASWALMAVKMLAGGPRFEREKMYLLWEFLRDMENTLILGERSGDYATKNTTTGSQTGWATEYPTTSGLLKLAARSSDFGKTLTLQRLRNQLPLDLGDTINDNQPLIAYLGNDAFGRIMDLFPDKHINMEGEGTLAKWGIKSYKLVTSGPEIELVKHETFNTPGLSNKMVVFAPENIGYVSLKGHDLTNNNKIETPPTHGQTDELYAYFGLETKDAGKSICIVNNLF
jgi:hypothetical protein